MVVGVSAAGAQVVPAGAVGNSVAAATSAGRAAKAEELAAWVGTAAPVVEKEATRRVVASVARAES